MKPLPTTINIFVAIEGDKYADIQTRLYMTEKCAEVVVWV